MMLNAMGPVMGELVGFLLLASGLALIMVLPALEPWDPCSGKGE